jgi:hypothetical protein
MSSRFAPYLCFMVPMIPIPPKLLRRMNMGAFTDWMDWDGSSGFDDVDMSMDNDDVLHEE